MDELGEIGGALNEAAREVLKEVLHAEKDPEKWNGDSKSLAKAGEKGLALTRKLARERGVSDEAIKAWEESGPRADDLLKTCRGMSDLVMQPAVSAMEPEEQASPGAGGGEDPPPSAPKSFASVANKAGRG